MLCIIDSGKHIPPSARISPVDWPVMVVSVPGYKVQSLFKSEKPINDLGTVSLPFYSLLSAFVM